jgi:hypothetical protein
MSVVGLGLMRACDTKEKTLAEHTIHLLRVVFVVEPTSIEHQRRRASLADDLLLRTRQLMETTPTCPNASAMFAASFSLMPTDDGSKPPCDSALHRYGMAQHTSIGQVRSIHHTRA